MRLPLSFRMSQLWDVPRVIVHTKICMVSPLGNRQVKFSTVVHVYIKCKVTTHRLSYIYIHIYTIKVAPLNLFLPTNPPPTLNLN